MLKKQTDIANEIILRLDQAQEARRLTTEELSLRRLAKQRVTGLAAIRRTKMRMRQRSRLTGIKLGDANTRLFHLRANGRRRKNFIPVLKHEGCMVTAHQDKAQLLYDYYSKLFTTLQPRSGSINWDLLDIRAHNLQQLDNQLTEEEVKRAVFEAPSEKAPGPDGFIGLFYKKCWEIIKQDYLTSALQQLFNLRADRWNLLNSANIALLPKKDGADTAADYRPISLMHSVTKIMGKVLANRLAPHLPALVSNSQSAFIKGRSILDNFQCIQGAVNTIKRRRRCTSLNWTLLKLLIVCGGNIC